MNYNILADVLKECTEMLREARKKTEKLKILGGEGE
jgi:hypothetical protein